MPCIDSETSEKWSQSTQNEKVNELQSTVNLKNIKINYLTDLLCQISNLKPDVCISQIGVYVPEYKNFVESHRLADENRWYQKYKNTYKSFTKEEIVRMVRAGILKN